MTSEDLIGQIARIVFPEEEHPAVPRGDTLIALMSMGIALLTLQLSCLIPVLQNLDDRANQTQVAPAKPGIDRAEQRMVHAEAIQSQMPAGNSSGVTKRAEAEVPVPSIGRSFLAPVYYDTVWSGEVLFIFVFVVQAIIILQTRRGRSGDKRALLTAFRVLGLWSKDDIPVGLYEGEIERIVKGGNFQMTEDKMQRLLLLHATISVPLRFPKVRKQEFAPQPQLL